MNKEKVYLLNGNGYGYGDGNGYGNGNGDGNGDGNGYGYGYGNGDGNGYGYGIYYAKIFGEMFEISGKIENSLCKNLPEHLFDKIDKAFLQEVDNLEALRELREKIGLEKYLSLFDAKIVDEDNDAQGNLMRLFKYDEKGNKVILLECICPSTNRMYHLYPPNQKAKNVFEAKASTFGENEFKPLIET